MTSQWNQSSVPGGQGQPRGGGRRATEEALQQHVPRRSPRSWERDPRLPFPPLPMKGVAWRSRSGQPKGRAAGHESPHWRAGAGGEGAAGDQLGGGVKCFQCLPAGNSKHSPAGGKGPDQWGASVLPLPGQPFPASESTRGSLAALRKGVSCTPQLLPSPVGGSQK